MTQCSNRLRKSGRRPAAAWLPLALLLAVLLPAAAQSPSPQSSAVPADEMAKANQLYIRGRQLQMAGKESEAVKVFASSLALVDKMLAASPADADLVHLQCWNLHRLGRHGEVTTAAQKLLQTTRDYRVMEVLAESLYFLERSEEALRYFASYVELAPAGDERLSSAYYYMGECYVRLRKYEHADIAFSTATTMEKNMYYWWYRLGYVKELLGQYRKAYEMYGKALELNSGYRFAIDARARVKAKAGL